MRYPIFPRLAADIEAARRRRAMRKVELAQRLGRKPARLSEFERDLESSRLGKDRLTLLVQICDALDLVPVLVPQQRLEEIDGLLGRSPVARPAASAPPSAFSEVFVSLDDEGED